MLYRQLFILEKIKKGSPFFADHFCIVISQLRRPHCLVVNMEADMETSSEHNGKYSVFFSHKVNDKRVTTSLIELLDGHTENVSFAISEQIEKGTPWRKAIAELLNRANFLVLVFTDPNEDWGWCLYELGFFDALSQSESRRRIWCLHNASTDPPSPIADLQSVPAKKTDVEQWLTELFKETGQTKSLFWKAIPELAEEICKLFSIDQKPIYSQRSVNIVADRTLLKSPDDLPDNATMEGDARSMGEVFGTSRSLSE